MAKRVPFHVAQQRFGTVVGKLVDALWFAASDRPGTIGVVAGFEDTGIGHVSPTEAKMGFGELTDVLQGYYDTQRIRHGAVSWIPRILTARSWPDEACLFCPGTPTNRGGPLGCHVRMHSDVEEHRVDPLIEPRGFLSRSARH